MNYYTKEEPIILREYGKIIQNYVQQCIGIEDKTMRNKTAYAIVEFMIQLQPSIKSTEDYRKKLWDHLFFIADYKLDVDAPYDIAEREFIVMTPSPLEYPRKENKFRHYGRYIVEVIEEAKKHDEEKRKVMASPIASYMKLVHKAWNNEVVNDSIVKNDLVNISQGMIEMADDENIRQLMPSLKPKMTHNHQNRNKNQKNKSNHPNQNPNNNPNQNPNKKKKNNNHHKNRQG